MDNSLDITKNIRTIEWLKAELLTETAELYMGMAKNADDDALGEAAANAVIAIYLLLNRLGISFVSLELKIQDTLRETIRAGYDLGKQNSDISALLKNGDISALLKHKMLEKK